MGFLALHGSGAAKSPFTIFFLLLVTDSGTGYGRSPGMPAPAKLRPWKGLLQSLHHGVLPLQEVLPTTAAECAPSLWTTCALQILQFCQHPKQLPFLLGSCCWLSCIAWQRRASCCFTASFAARPGKLLGQTRLCCFAVLTVHIPTLHPPPSI